MPIPAWDVIVVGAGGMGSAACYHAARRGARVLGIDRWMPPHVHGSSHGATRIIRRAYFEHPDYVPLVNRAYTHWRALEAETNQSLMAVCGLLQIGPAEGRVIRGVLSSVRAHGLEASQWDAAEVRQRFPMFRLQDDWVGVWEPGAGYLRVESCVQAHLEAAQRSGAELRSGHVVKALERKGNLVRVTCDEESYLGNSVILTPGPWGTHWMSDLGISLRVVQKQLHWLDAPEEYSEQAGFPTFLVESPGGVFYGFPKLDDQGLKLAEHSGGREVESPDAAPSNEDEEDSARVGDFVDQCLPSLGFRRRQVARCYYTMTHDEHFVVDRHPTMDGVWVGVGFSGHGFKFAPTIGEALADYALNGATDLPVAFLRRCGRSL